MARNFKDFHLFSRKVIGIGRNFAEHAKELGNAVPTRPMFFLKPPSSIVLQPNPVEQPKDVELHHEIELGVVISRSGRDIPASQAGDHVAGYCLAFDMTARNVQDRAKRAGAPWSEAKGFDTFTAIGPFLPKEKVPDPHDVRLWCSVDGAIKQDGTTRDMIFKIPDLISHVSQIMTLEEGDLILTGTPAGVGKVEAGQVLEAGMGSGADKEGLGRIRFPVVRRPGKGMYGW
ncbi:hypothetical protein DFJ74DRAFT_657110 [Hyaloraphidium curvatum]|nr:hypothetical protein DFJ74DRAFT_657110 [Hyaloraphidium curvatum]